MIIRAYKQTDCSELAQLFFETVHTVNCQDYNEEQLNAWATGNVELDQWNSSFLNHYTIVAEEHGEIVGFGDMTVDGYLDRLYVHRAYQRQGIATAICDRLEEMVGVRRLTVHASITAKGFFEKRGYRIVKEQHVERHGVFLKNYMMEYWFPDD